MTSTTFEVASEDLDTTVTRLSVAAETWSGGAAVIAQDARIHLTQLRTALAATNDDRIVVIAQRNAAIDALSTFMDSVRDAAIEAQAGHASHFSKHSLNEWLEALGLDPLVTKWDCDGSWQGIDLPSATVVADSEDEATTKYREALAEGSVEVGIRLSGDVSDTDDVTFSSNYIDDSSDYGDDVPTFDVDDVDINVSASDD